MSHKLLVIAGPSAVGKSYLMQQLLERYPDQTLVPRLITTRQPRPHETAADREFVSRQDYEVLLRSGAFAWADSFYGNQYGYTHAALRPTDKHVAINVLPSMVAEFARLPQVVLIGLTVNERHIALLEARLRGRGDKAAEVSARRAAWQADIATMSAHTDLFRRSGQLFSMASDDSLAPVLAWLGQHVYQSN